MSITTSPLPEPEDSFDAHFGLCPICGRNDGFLNIGPDHVFVCNEHRVWWPVGSNLFSAWRLEDDTIWERNWKKIQGYRKVEPIHSPSMMRKDHMLWPAIEPKVNVDLLHSWFEASTPETEKAIIDAVSRCIGSLGRSVHVAVSGDGDGFEIVDLENETTVFIDDDGGIHPNPKWEDARNHAMAIIAALREAGA